MNYRDRILWTVSNSTKYFKGKNDDLTVFRLPEEQSGVKSKKFIEELLDYVIEKNKYRELMRDLIEDKKDNVDAAVGEKPTLPKNKKIN